MPTLLPEKVLGYRYSWDPANGLKVNSLVAAAIQGKMSVLRLVRHPTIWLILTGRMQDGSD